MKGHKNNNKNIMFTQKAQKAAFGKWKKFAEDSKFEFAKNNFAGRKLTKKF